MAGLAIGLLVLFLEPQKVLPAGSDLWRWDGYG